MQWISWSQYLNTQDKDRCNRMVTGNIISCPKAYKDGLDKAIVKDINMLMKLIKKNRMLGYLFTLSQLRRSTAYRFKVISLFYPLYEWFTWTKSSATSIISSRLPTVQPRCSTHATFTLADIILTREIINSWLRGLYLHLHQWVLNNLFLLLTGPILGPSIFH